MRTEAQSLTVDQESWLPAYEDSHRYEKGRTYVFRKRENEEEPRPRAKALKAFWKRRDAIDWSRKHFSSFDWCIVSK